MDVKMDSPQMTQMTQMKMSSKPLGSKPLPGDVMSESLWTKSFGAGRLAARRLNGLVPHGFDCSSLSSRPSVAADDRRGKLLLRTAPVRMDVKMDSPQITQMTQMKMSSKPLGSKPLPGDVMSKSLWTKSFAAGRLAARRLNGLVPHGFDNSPLSSRLVVPPLLNDFVRNDFDTSPLPNGFDNSHFLP
jgi:hypothetical protein